MNKLESYLVYQPPKSNSHGHWVRDKNIGRGLQRTIHAFVNNLNMHQDGDLDIRLPKDDNSESDISWKNTRELFIKHFGEPSYGQQPLFDGIKDALMWKASISLFDLLEMFEPAKLKDLIPLDYLWLHAAYAYGHADSPHGTVSCFIIPHKLLISLRIILPYTIEDPRLYELIRKLHTDLPFKMSEKHFRRLGPSKRGYGPWKLDKEIQEKVAASLGTI
jgi:hypothetical protein